MGTKKVVRLTGRWLFVYYHFKIGMGNSKIFVGACTNKRVLAKKTGIDYNTLMFNFTRKNRVYYANEETIVMKLYVSDIEKGGQSLARRGKGGMESFARFVMNKGREY